MKRLKNKIRYCLQLIKNRFDPKNAKEYYNCYLKRRNTTIKNNYSVKSVIIEYSKTSCKFSKTIRPAEKTSQIGSGKSPSRPLYRVKKRVKIFLTKKI